MWVSKPSKDRNIAINPLLLKLINEGCRVCGYADDVAITISGRYIDTIFFRKHTTPNIVPLVVRGTPINIPEEAKYLGLILYRKLSWKQNCQERTRKATIAL